MHFKAILAASAAILLSTVAAQSAQVAALVGDNTIAVVDTNAKKVVKTWPIQGLSGKVAGIDVRPSDNMLYAVTWDGGVYTVDAATGKATMKSKLETMLEPGTAATIDFNPVADRMRLIGSDGTDLRANVDDGKATVDGSLKFAETDMHKGEKPNVVAGAYINSFTGARKPRCTTSTPPSARCLSRRRRMTAYSARSASSASVRGGRVRHLVGRPGQERGLGDGLRRPAQHQQDRRVEEEGKYGSLMPARSGAITGSLVLALAVRQMSKATGPSTLTPSLPMVLSTPSFGGACLRSAPIVRVDVVERGLLGALHELV